jgi:hypothetical protein
MKTLGRLYLSLLFIILMSAATLGQDSVTVPYTDHFNYNTGSIGGQGKWVNLNTGDSLIVTAGNLSYPGFAASTGKKLAFDGAGKDPAITFTQTYSGKIYASFLLKISSLGSMNTTGGYIATFYQGAASVTSGTLLWLRKDADGTSFDIGLSSRTTTTISWTTAKTVGTTYLIVMDYEIVSGATNDVSNLWINPDASSFGSATVPTPALTTTNSAADLTGLGRFTIRQDATTATPFCELDELRIGAAWADVTPAFSATNYYSKSSGNLDLLSTWGTNTDGSGTAPSDFTSDAQIFNVRNQANPSIGANWIVSGSTSNVILGNGTNACNFTIGSTYSYTGPIDVSANGTLTLQNTTIPTLGTCNAASTVDYAGTSAQSIVSATYGNLKISNTAGATAPATMSIAGNLTNNGVFTHNSGTIIFNGSASQTIGGTSSTAFNNVTVNSGSGQSNILEATSVISVNGALTISSGTLKISSASTLNLATWTSVPAAGGFWLNNAGASVTIGSGNTTFNGLLRLTNGTFNTGVAADQNINCNTTATFVIEGGTLNIAGRLSRASSPSGSYTQTGGTVNVATLGSTATGCFYFGSAGSTFNMSGGTIVIQQPNTGTSADYTILSGGTTSVTGGTVQFGNASTPAGQTFRVSSTSVPIYNLVVNGTTNAKTVQAKYDFDVANSLTIETGSTLDLFNNVVSFAGATVTNNGRIIGALSTYPDSRFNFSGASVAQTYLGTGTVGTYTDPLAGIGFSNALGVTINSGVTNLNVNRINAFMGTVHNTNKLTIGNDSSKVSYILIGSTVANAGTAGVLDVAPDFQLTGGLTLYYGNAGNVPSTGVEIPSSRSLVNLTINNAAGGAVIAGGNVTVNGVLTLSKGLLDIASNDLILGSAATIAGAPADSAMVVSSGSGHVKKAVAAVPFQFTFPVGDKTGTAEYSPVNVTLSSGTLSSAYIGVAVSNAKYSNNSSSTDYLNRYWTLTAEGITDPVHTDTLTYVDADIAGTEASLTGGLYNGSSWSSLGAVSADNNQIIGTNLTSFGVITAGESGAFSSAGTVVVKVIPQGFYNDGDYLNSSDTVTVLLASASSPYAVVDSAVVVLDSISFQASASLTTAESGNYYIVIKHRNSIETWSASAVAYTKGSTTNYDFTTDASAAYGNNEVAVGSAGRYAIYSGDVNQDGYVDPLDLSLIDQDSYNYVSGRALGTDINGDGYVDPLDLSICDQNSFNYVGVKLPASGRFAAKSRAPQGIHFDEYLKTLKK